MEQLIASCPNEENFLVQSMHSTFATMDLAEDLFRLLEGKERAVFNNTNNNNNKHCFIGMLPILLGFFSFMSF